jgi:APA family basic amino acid/polyamine antiporter
VGFSAPTALAAIAFEHYMLSVFPALPAHGIAPGVIVLATAVYLTRVEIGSTFLATFTYIKLLALLIVSVALMTVFCGESPRFTPASNDLSTLVSAPFAISLVYVMYAYSGWNASTYIVNEIRSPQVNVPRSLILGTLVVACLYVMVNAGFLISTPTEAYAGRVEVAVIAARFAFGLPGAVMVSLLIGMGLISTVAALTWSGPRVSQMMGQDFPALSVLARTSHTGTPYVAVVVQACIALLMIATSSFEPIMVFMQFVLILSSMLTVSAVVWLRFRRPEMERPFRVPLYPLPPLLFCGVSMLMLVYTAKERAKESLLGFGLVGLGLLVYLACRRASSRPPR